MTFPKPKERERDVVLSVSDVSVSFGNAVVLDGVSFDVFRGEILGFVGATGGGKSVLLRTVLGLPPENVRHDPPLRSRYGQAYR